MSAVRKQREREQENFHICKYLKLSLQSFSPTSTTVLPASLAPPTFPLSRQTVNCSSEATNQENGTIIMCEQRQVNYVIINQCVCVCLVRVCMHVSVCISWWREHREKDRKAFFWEGCMRACHTSVK